MNELLKNIFSFSERYKTPAEFKTGANGVNPLSSDGGNLWVSLSSGIDYVIRFILILNKRSGYCLDKPVLLLKGGRSGYNHCSQSCCASFFT